MKLIWSIIVLTLVLSGCGSSNKTEASSDNTEAPLSLQASQTIADKFAQNAAISYSVFQDTTLQLEFTYDTEGESFAITTLPTDGALTGQLEGGDLSLLYTPNFGYIGNDSIGFTVTHKDGGVATGTVDIVIILAQVLPTLPDTRLSDSQKIADQLALNLSSTYTLYKNTNTAIVLGNGNQQDYVVAVSTLPTDGLLTGQLSGQQVNALYVPNNNYSGTDTLTFTITHVDGGVATGTIAITVLAQLDASLDTDGDGLSDLDEVDFYGTSPISDDTDADGFTDFQEIVVYGFDANANNFRFNPLIADIPQIDIQMVSAPDIFMNFTESNGTASTVSTTRSESSSNTVSNSSTSETSTSFEHSYSASLEIGVEQELVATTATVGTQNKWSAKVTVSSSIAWGETKSNSWTNEQSSENSKALEEGKAFEDSRSIESSGGGVTVNVKIRNTGHISYTLENLYLNASYYDLAQNNPVVPIGNLVWENQSVNSFPQFTLAPGDSTNIIAYTTAELSIATTKGLLANSKGLSIKPTVFDMLDENGVSYAFNQTGIQAQDATVIIDFGGVNQSANITKLISTNANPNQTGISIQDALETVLQLDVGTDVTDGFINSVNSLSNDEPNGYWVIAHAAQSGNNKIVTTIYTTPTDQTRVQIENSGVSNLVSSYDISAIRLHGGDLLQLVYMLDDDQDGLSNRDEFFYRTDVNNPDTDGDGLTDLTEVTGWAVSYTEITGSPVTINVKSNPLAVDSDLDQLSDFVEANLTTSDTTLKRNPTSKDTDDDGIDDLADDLDPNVVGSPANFLSNKFDKVDLIALTATVDTPNAFPSNVTFNYDTLDVTELGAGNAGNGINEYIVNVYRHGSSNGTHPEPLSPPLDLSPIVNLGQTLTCGVGCSWKLVHLGADLPGAVTITSTEDGTSVTNQIASGDDFKYIVYLRINGRYYRSAYTAIASASTETVTLHMLSGKLNSVKTVADHSTLLSKSGILRYSAAQDEVFYEMGTSFGDYVYTYTYPNGAVYLFSSSGNRAFGNVYNGTTGALKKSNIYYDRCPINSGFSGGGFGSISNMCWIKLDYLINQSNATLPNGGIGYVTDDINASDSPPYTHPLGSGDNHFSLNWRVVFDGKEITPRPDFAGANTGPVREICGSMQTRSRDLKHAVAKNNLDTVYLNSLYNSNDCSNISAIADNGSDGGPTGTATGYTLTNGAATFSVDVPAQEGCHYIRLYAYEYDHIVGSYNSVYQPYGNDLHSNTDSAQLCRSNTGVWTLNHASVDPLHDKGTVISPVTSAGSLNNIQYQTRKMQWKDDKATNARTTMEGDLTIRYDISVN